MLLRRPSVFALAIPLFLFAATATAQSNYTIKRLTCAGLGHGVAWDIDNNGNVVGEMLDGNGISRAVVWRNGVGEALTLLPAGNAGVAFTIANDELIGGSSGCATSNGGAAVWLPTTGSSTPVDLGARGTGFAAAVLGIASGSAVGFVDDGIFSTPAAWHGIAASPTLQLLPLPPWAVAGEASALTGTDFIVGLVADFGTTKPVYWDLSGATPTVTELPTLGNWGRINDVNGSGVAVGSSISSTTGYMHMVSWSNAMITDLGQLPGMDCFGEAINEFGDVVGWARTYSTPAYTAIVKLAGSPIQDLNSMLPLQSGWSAVRAHGINNAGHIVGSGVIDGYFEPFVMIPTQVALRDPQPGLAGVSNTFTVSGVTPSATVYYAVGLIGGETPIPGCLEGLDLASPLIFATSVAAGDGNASLTVPVPLGLGQIPFLVQAYDYVGCATSNVVAATFF